MLDIRNLTKFYKPKKGSPVKALDNVSIKFQENGLVFLLGKSGSGKSTLLNLIGGLDKYDEGEIIIKGRSSKDFKQQDFDSYRNTYVGFIFQEYNILEEFTVYKNISLALELQGKKADKQAVESIIDRVDLRAEAKRKPGELSGGQKQRVAIARALVKSPEIIMADEPTGALDSNTGKQVFETLKELSKEKLVIIVSHDRESAELYGDRIIELKDGKIIRDTVKDSIATNKISAGISVFDNKLIHIKKGHKITDGELKKIYAHINKNNDSDTIISFDAEVNSEVRKGTAMNESGNMGVFRQTTHQDIKSKQYNPNDFSLIKSRLSLTASLKMGCSALKNKKFRLVFAIFLSVISLALFGLVHTFASFDRATSMYNSLKNFNADSICIGKEYYDNIYHEVEFNINDFAKLQNKFSEYTFTPILYPAAAFRNLDEFEYSIYINKLSGFAAMPSALELSAKGITLIGNEPVNYDEFTISEHTFNTLVSLSHGQIKEYSDVLNRFFFNIINTNTEHQYENCRNNSAPKTF